MSTNDCPTCKKEFGSFVRRKSACDVCQVAICSDCVIGVFKKYCPPCKAVRREEKAAAAIAEAGKAAHSNSSTLTFNADIATRTRRSSSIFGSLLGNSSAMDEPSAHPAGLEWRAHLEQVRRLQVEALTQWEKLLSQRKADVKTRLKYIEKGLKALEATVEATEIENDFPPEARELLVHLRHQHQFWARERLAIKLEQNFPGGAKRWKVRARPQDSLYFGLKDIQIDSVDAQFTIRAGDDDLSAVPSSSSSSSSTPAAPTSSSSPSSPSTTSLPPASPSPSTAARVVLELNQGRIDLSLEQLRLCGSSTTAKMLQAFVLPEALSLSVLIHRLVIPFEWQPIPVEPVAKKSKKKKEQQQQQQQPKGPTHRWVMDEANLTIDWKIEKKLRGGSFAPGDALIEWLGKVGLPSVLRYLTVFLPDELGELLGRRNFRWLCAGRLSLFAQLSRSVWTAPLDLNDNDGDASSTGAGGSGGKDEASVDDDDSPTELAREARAALGLNDCLPRMTQLKSFITQGCLTDVFPVLSLQSLFRFYQQFSEKSEDMQSILEAWDQALQSMEQSSQSSNSEMNSDASSSSSSSPSSTSSSTSSSPLLPSIPTSSSSSPSSTPASHLAWLTDLFARVAKLGRQRMLLNLRLSRFDLQLDVFDLLDRTLAFVKRIGGGGAESTTTDGGGGVEKKTNDSAAVTDSKAAIAASAAENPHSVSPASSDYVAQLLLDITMALHRVFEHSDQLQATLNAQLYGADDAHLDVSLEDVSLRARAPVIPKVVFDPAAAYQYMEPARPGFSLHVGHTDDGLSQTSVFVYEKERIPAAAKAHASEFPSALSCIFTLGGLQLLMFPYRPPRSSGGLRRPSVEARDFLTHHPDFAAGNSSSALPLSPSSSSLSPSSRPLSTRPGSVSLNLAHVGVSFPLWIFLFQQWRRFFGSGDDVDVDDEKGGLLETDPSEDPKESVSESGGSRPTDTMSVVSSASSDSESSQTLNEALQDFISTKYGSPSSSSTASSSPPTSAGPDSSSATDFPVAASESPAAAATSARGRSQSIFAGFFSSSPKVPQPDIAAARKYIRKVDALSAYSTPLPPPVIRPVATIFAPFLLDSKHRLKIQCVLNVSLLVSHALSEVSSSSSSSFSPSPVAMLDEAPTVRARGRSLTSAIISLPENLSAKLRLSTEGQDDFFQVELAFYLYDLLLDIDSFVQGEAEF